MVSGGKLRAMVFVPEHQLIFITDSLGEIHIMNSVHVPPRKVHKLTTDSKNSLKTLKFDADSNLLYTCCFHDGRIYGYHLGDNFKESPEITKKFSISSMRFCRELEIMPEFNLMFVGYSGGFVYVYDMENTSSPICKFN